MELGIESPITFHAAGDRLEFSRPGGPSGKDHVVAAGEDHEELVPGRGVVEGNAAGGGGAGSDRHVIKRAGHMEDGNRDS